MRLTVLGGSAAIPNAGAGCAGFLIEDGPARVVLDLGPGTLAELRRHADLAVIDAVVISHMHVDHVLDVVALRHGLAFKPDPLPKPLPVWLPPGGEATLRAVLAPLEAWQPAGRFDRAVTLQEYNPSVELDIGGGRSSAPGHGVGWPPNATLGDGGDTCPGLTLTFHPTVHDIPCWAIRVQGAGGAVVYGADGGPASDLAAFAWSADLLIAEATLVEGDTDPIRGSLTAVEAGQLATRAGARRLLLTHMWQEHAPEAQRAAAANSYGGPIDLARPGVAVEV